MDFESSKSNLFDTLLSKSFEVYSPKEQDEGVSYIPPFEEADQQASPLLEEEDRDILMHRDIHFSANFALMADYYDKEGKGAVLDVCNSRIYQLMELEERLGRDLAPLVLQGADAERVGKARNLYQNLQKQYEDPKTTPELLAIIDLIFSEEEEPEQDAQLAASIGETMIPYLISIIKTEELYDPLFPGYGKAPIAAALALGFLKAEAAIEPLFLMLTKYDFEIESASLAALALIGDKAQDFCLKMLTSRPITLDNERAAIACCTFPPNEILGQAILSQLQDKEIQKKERLATYLVLACENLPENQMSLLKEIALAGTLPKNVQDEITVILKNRKF